MFTLAHLVRCLLDNGTVKESHAARVQPWRATAAIIVAEVVGTGVLALGGSYGQLGPAFGLSVLIGGLVMNIITSLFLGKVATAFPDVVTIGDALQELLGHTAGLVGYGIVYFYLFTTLGGYIVVLARAVRATVWQLDVCQPVATAINCLLLLPSNQVRTLSGLTILSAVSVVTIVLTLGICLGTLMQLAGHSSREACTGLPADGSFDTGLNANVGSFIFAYTGQAVMLELQAEMKQKKQNRRRRRRRSRRSRTGWPQNTNG